MFSYLKNLLSPKTSIPRKNAMETRSMKLLHLDSSILSTYSVSRTLSSEIVARHASLYPNIEVVYRDLATDAALHLSGAHLAAWQGTPVEDAALGKDLASGGAYLDELFAADIIVIGAPMYNFVPSQLKAWIDCVVVAGKTFRYTENGASEGLRPGRSVHRLSRGGVYSAGGPAAALEHHESYLTGILAFIGIPDDGRSC